MIQYVAFLRGINVGGKHLVRMEALRALFESMGLKNVKTFIQSGNVLFGSAETDHVALTRKIEKALAKALGYEVSVMLRTGAELVALIQLDPFKNTRSDGDPVKYVTFLSAELKNKPKLPLYSPTNDCAIIHLRPREIFTIAFLMPNGRSGNVMALIEKEAGKSATTRNWNTITRIVALANI